MKGRVGFALATCAVALMACDKAPKPEVGRAVAPTMKAPPEVEEPELPSKKDVTFEPDVPQTIFDEVDSLVKPPAYHANPDHLLHPMEFEAGYYGFTKDGLMLVSAEGVASWVKAPKGVAPESLRLEAVSSTHILWSNTSAKTLVAIDNADGESLWSYELCGVPEQVAMTAKVAYWKTSCGEGLVTRKTLIGVGKVETLSPEISKQVVELCADAKGVVAAYEMDHIQWDDGKRDDPISTLRPQRGPLCRFTHDGGQLLWISVDAIGKKPRSAFGQMGARVNSQKGVLDPAKAPRDAEPLEPAGVVMGWSSNIVSRQPTRIPYTYGDISSRTEAGREWVFSGWDIYPGFMKVVALNEYEVAVEAGVVRRAPKPTSTPGYLMLDRQGRTKRFDTAYHPSGVRFVSERALVWLEGGKVIKRMEW